jgi:RNA recognition motif-containing protein
MMGTVLLRRSVESLLQASAMAKRLYVGNLKYTVTSAQLQELFEQFGTVSSAQVLSDRETGRSRGFGFVEMVNDDEALAAIEGLDGQDHDGRRLTVNEARPRTPGGGGGGGGGYRGGGGGGYRGGGGGYGGDY